MAYVRLLLGTDYYAEEAPFTREPLRFAALPDSDPLAYPHR